MIADIVSKIATEAGMREGEVKNKIMEKREELSMLISEEGAAYIVAKELGVSLRKHERLFIQNVVPDMKNVDIVGRIVKIPPVTEFKTAKAEGKVQNFFIADETGSVRATLWNDEIEKYNFNNFKEGDVIRLKGFVKEDNLGEPELRLGRYGLLQESKEKMPESAVVQTGKRNARVRISDIQEGQFKELRAGLVQVFESQPFFKVCSNCGGRYKEKCEEHPDAEPEYRMILSGIIDDGTENIRAVFFGEHAEKLLGMSTAEARKQLDMNNNDIKKLLDNVDVGKEFVLEGKIRRNKFFDRLEFIASGVRSVDVKKEIELLGNH